MQELFLKKLKLFSYTMFTFFVHKIYTIFEVKNKTILHESDYVCNKPTYYQYKHQKSQTELKQNE